MLNVLLNGAKAKTITQPKAIYRQVESHLGQLNQTILNTTPKIAVTATNVKIPEPSAPSSEIRQKGA